MTLNRRHFVQTGLLAGASIALLGSAARSQELKTIKLGFQKTGLPLIAKQLGVFEKRFGEKGIKVEWAEFVSGLTLLQALDINGVSYGNSGDLGCIFVQASGGKIVYIAAQPSARKGQAILVKEGSPINDIADLKGKKVGYAKGSGSHNYIALALEQNNLSLDDITSIGLSSADGAIAFDNDSIDAWVTWEPYVSITEARVPSRAISYSGDVLKGNAGFLLAHTGLVEKHPELIKELVAGSIEAAEWAKTHQEDVSQAFARDIGVDIEIARKVTANTGYDVGPLTDEVLDAQQATADRFFKLGLLPTAVRVRDIVWQG